MRSLLLTFAFSVLLALHLASQVIEPDPQPPFLKSLPSRASWTISTVPAASPEGVVPPPVNPTTIVQVTMEKIDDLKRARLKSQGGQLFEYWAKGQFIFNMDPSTQSAIVMDMRKAMLPDLLYQAMQDDFPDLDWISLDAFGGRVVEKGKTLLLFETEKIYVDGKDTDKKELAWGVKVLIDDKTRLPVRVETGSMVKTYNFLPPPDGLQLPEACRLEWERFQKYLLETTVDTPAR